MCRFLGIAILSSMAFAQVSATADSKSAQLPGSHIASLENPLVALPDLPPGKSTVIGGAIIGVDLVRDQLMLNVFGGRPLKVLFDARTHFYRDGIRTPLHELRSGDHVSVETMLDGTTVFARSIHMLSALPEGECQGQVMNYNPGDRELTVRDDLSREPIKLRLPAGTAVIRQSRTASGATVLGSSSFSSTINSSDLPKGTLISVNFQSDNKGHGVASQIVILATPGSTFVFAGNVASLDLHSGLLALIDPRDDKRYQIVFDSAHIPMSHDLHEGADVTVTAKFDGGRYVANTITVNSASEK
jgi:hypothetical protein